MKKNKCFVKGSGRGVDHKLWKKKSRLRVKFKATIMKWYIPQSTKRRSNNNGWKIPRRPSNGEIIREKNLARKRKTSLCRSLRPSIHTSISSLNTDGPMILEKKRGSLRNKSPEFRSMCMALNSPSPPNSPSSPPPPPSQTQRIRTTIDHHLECPRTVCLKLFPVQGEWWTSKTVHIHKPNELVIRETLR